MRKIALLFLLTVNTLYAQIDSSQYVDGIDFFSYIHSQKQAYGDSVVFLEWVRIYDTLWTSRYHSGDWNDVVEAWKNNELGGLTTQDSTRLDSLWGLYENNDLGGSGLSGQDSTRLDSLWDLYTNDLLASPPDTMDGNRPITLDVPGLSGINPATNNIAQWLETVFYPSQVPTASLTLTFDGSTSGNNRILEKGSGPRNATVNWTAGRQASTAELNTISINGVSISFSQPTAGNSTNGTHNPVWNTEADTSFTLSVTTTDGKTATGRIEIDYRWKRYWGFSSSDNPGHNVLWNFAQEYHSTRTKGETTATNSCGPCYFIIAFEESYDPGANSQVWVNGLNATGAFTRSVKSFVNESIGTTDYIFYISNSLQNGDITFEIR